MENPWTLLPSEPPFVLPADRPYVEAANRDRSERYRLATELVPEPFAGAHHAPLVVLSLNPGIQDADFEVHRSPDHRAMLLGNLQPERSVLLGLRDAFQGTPAGRWWRRCFKAVIGQGHQPEDLARRVLSVEFHGYHSRAWQPLPITLPSQPYTFGLVEQAVQRGATVVVLRGWSAWRVAVPRLNDYPGAVWAFPRAGTISPRSCGVEPFQRVLRALDA